MKIKTLILLIFIFQIAFSSCINTEKSIKLKNLTSFLNQHNRNLDNKKYIIIPTNLCGNCVKTVVEFLNNNKDIVDKKNTIIILTDYTSVTFPSIQEKLKGFFVIQDNTFKVVKDNIVKGDKIIIISIKNQKISKMMDFLPNENEEDFFNFLLENNNN